MRTRIGTIVGMCALFAASLCMTASATQVGVSYTHYRFKVDAVYGSSAIGMQIGELALMCDGENVTRKHFESVSRADPVPKSVSGNGDGFWNGAETNAYQGVMYAIDGTTGTSQTGTSQMKFYDCNASPLRSNDEYRDKCWVELAYTNAVRVTAYRWSTADDSVALNTGCRSPKNFRLQGSNDGETWVDIDVQTDFTPPTTTFTWTEAFPVGGASDMSGYATDAKWFRWTILRHQSYNNHEDVSGQQMRMQVSEFDLYDVDGNRLTVGMTPVENVTAPTDLNPGEVTWFGTLGIGQDKFENLMDGDLQSKFQGYGAFNSVKNIKVVMRLPADAAPVAGYNLATGYDAPTYPERNPVRWTLEASYDGETWFTVDDRRDVVPPKDGQMWYNAGIPFTFRGQAKSGDVVTVGAFDADTVPGNPFPGRGITVKKVGGGSLDYAGGVPSGVEVADGTLTIMPTFSKFRFKTDALPPAATGSFGVQMAELMLFDDWTNVTYAGLTSATKATGPIYYGTLFDGQPASRGVDGVWGVEQGYYDCNISPVRSYDPNWDMCYLRVDYSSPRRVTSYAWATGHDNYNSSASGCRHPYDFRLQGSNDGETWTDLDVRTGFIAPNASNVMTRAFSCPAMQDIAQGTGAKLFRLTIKSKKDNTVNSMQISEFGLFDATGTRVNTNLVVNAKDKTAASLAAGEATASAPKSVNLNSAEGLVRLFDGDCTTKFLYSNGGTFNVDDSSTWLVITMRLWDDAPDVCSYGFATANDAPTRDPDVWLLEASTDGTTWTKLDERAGYNMTDKRQVWDSYCVPFAELARSAEWCVSNVSVVAGATLNVGDDRVQIGGLTVDCSTGGGTISRFNVAETGVINLVKKSGGVPHKYVLPLTVGEYVNAENLANWSVAVNGVQKPAASVRFENGAITLQGGGLCIIYK